MHTRRTSGAVAHGFPARHASRNFSCFLETLIKSFCRGRHDRFQKHPTQRFHQLTSWAGERVARLSGAHHQLSTLQERVAHDQEGALPKASPMMRLMIRPIAGEVQQCVESEPSHVFQGLIVMVAFQFMTSSHPFHRA